MRACSGSQEKGRGFDSHPGPLMVDPRRQRLLVEYLDVGDHFQFLFFSALCRNLNGLNKEILQEQKAVHVLQAEWGYLTRPEHIETLSQRLLPHLQPPTAQQIGNIDQLQATVSPASAKGP